MMILLVVVYNLINRFGSDGEKKPTQFPLFYYYLNFVKKQFILARKKGIMCLKVVNKREGY